MSENPEREFQVRQYKLLLRSLKNYPENAADLCAIIDDVEAIRSVLSEALNPSTAREIFDNLITLEEVYGIMQDEGRNDMQTVERSLVHAAVDALVATTENQLRRLEHELKNESLE